ncbi:MAG: PD-(D/E)XK nuclease family protein [Planctomycetota bacterium]
MTIKRIFLDWSRPALAAAVDYLVQRFASVGQLNLENVVLALPGGRAGRRLLEILVEQAEKRQLQLRPPRIVTAGKLPELLYEAKRPFAGSLIQQVAWIEALRVSDPRQVQTIVPSLPAQDDLLAWLSLGDMFGRLHRELAAEDLDFPSVALRGSQIEGFQEASRWQALAEIQKHYLATLDRLGLWDLQTARLVAIRNRECRSEAQIVLIGTADLNRSQRRMLDQVADRVTALVFAPPNLEDRFDEHGCVSPSAWLEQKIPLAAEQIEVADDPVDQAAAVVRTLADFDGRYNTEQIAIGVPDEQLVPYLQQRLRECDLPARYGVGVGIARSAPYRLIAAVADYVETSGFSAFAALLRHPWVNDWLAAQGITGDWLSEIDRYRAEHLPHTLEGLWKGENTLPSPLLGEGQGVRAYQAIESLCRELRGTSRLLAEWTPPILELIVKVFGRAPLNTDIEPDRSILASCNKIREVLDEYRQVPAELMPSLQSTEVMRFVLRQVDGETIPPPPDHGAIEILGWLELALDDAPALVVTSFNEGNVPASLNSDLFLPNQLRRELDIEDNDRRYARDAYTLSVLVASKEHLRLITGRRSADGDPLLPSRLLFTCDDPTMAKRVMAFFSAEPASLSGAITLGKLQAGQEQSRLEVPRPKRLAAPITSMRVTEFKDYLGCPYRYYLRHVLKLESLDDSAQELDGAAFGSLAHEVLHTLGKDPEVAAGKADVIANYLEAQLAAVVRSHFGKTPMPSILVQVEQLRRRLAALAQWQAAWAAQGWRIEHVEVSPAEGKAYLDVDGQPMFLRGRIDRIDIQEASGNRMIFDYKTSDAAKSPEKAHRKKSGEWIDLQLPLYRHLVAGLGIEGPVDLAYINLPKDISAVGHLAAGWTQADFDDADQTATNVIRRVRAEEFWPPTNPPPVFSEEFAAICQDDRFAAVIADEETEGGGVP